MGLEAGRTSTPTQAERRLAGQLTPRGERTRAALVDAARRVFEDKGYVQARISDIADAAGVAHGSFYTYFESKEAVFADVAAMIEVEMFPAGTGTSLRAGRPAEAVAAIEHANRRYLEAYRDNARFMRTLNEVAAVDPDIAAVREARTQGAWPRISQALARLEELGLATTPLDPDYVAIALTSMVSRYAASWLSDAVDLGRDLELDESVHTLTLLWATAIGLDTEEWLAGVEARRAPERDGDSS